MSQPSLYDEIKFDKDVKFYVRHGRIVDKNHEINSVKQCK